MEEKRISRAELDPVKLAIFDVDGTLARDDAMLSPATYQALGRLGESGITVVIATGRTRNASAEILNRAGVPGYIVSYNGALTMHHPTGRVLDISPLNRDLLSECWMLDSEHHLELTVFSDQKIYSRVDGEARRLLGIACNEEPVLIENLADIDRDPDHSVPLKAMFYRDAQYVDELRRVVLQRFPFAVQTLPEFIELANPHISKAHGLELILNDLGLTWSQTLGVGDSENDMQWLPKVGISLCPSNAYDCVKAICDYQIGSNDEDCVAAFIDSWLG